MIACLRSRRRKTEEKFTSRKLPIVKHIESTAMTHWLRWTSGLLGVLVVTATGLTAAEEQEWHMPEDEVNSGRSIYTSYFEVLV